MWEANDVDQLGLVGEGNDVDLLGIVGEANDDDLLGLDTKLLHNHFSHKFPG